MGKFIIDYYWYGWLIYVFLFAPLISIFIKIHEEKMEYLAWNTLILSFVWPIGLLIHIIGLICFLFLIFFELIGEINIYNAGD